MHCVKGILDLRICSTTLSSTNQFQELKILLRHFPVKEYSIIKLTVPLDEFLGSMNEMSGMMSGLGVAMPTPLQMPRAGLYITPYPHVLPSVILLALLMRWVFHGPPILSGTAVIQELFCYFVTNSSHTSSHWYILQKEFPGPVLGVPTLLFKSRAS